MSTDLRAALERLDGSIDHLEKAAASVAVRKGGRGVHNGTRNRTEVLGRLDSLIERLESFLTH